MDTAVDNQKSISDGGSGESPPGSASPRKKTRKRAITGFGVVMLGVLALSIAFFLTFKTVQVSGRSMVPTFKNGERVLVSSAYWLLGPPGKNDIVVIRDSGATGFIIKRIVYTEGEEVDWKYQPESIPLTDGKKYVVPEKSVYVLGDNLPESEDSRKFGPVERSEILGKVIKWR